MDTNHQEACQACGELEDERLIQEIPELGMRVCDTCYQGYLEEQHHEAERAMGDATP